MTIQESDTDGDDEEEVILQLKRRRGRKTVIDEEKLLSLLALDFNVSDIASKGLLGRKVHRNTIHNFLKKRDLQVRKKFAPIPNMDLTNLVAKLANEHPNSGYREIRSLLATQTPPVRIQRDCLQSILREVDPAGVTRRWATTIRRRNYQVPTANYMWHVDTHHKLIRWKFVPSVLNFIKDKQRN